MLDGYRHGTGRFDHPPFLSTRTLPFPSLVSFFLSLFGSCFHPASRSLYEGHWRNGHREGKGTLFYHVDVPDEEGEGGASGTMRGRDKQEQSRKEQEQEEQKWTEEHNVKGEQKNKQQEGKEQVSMKTMI